MQWTALGLLVLPAAITSVIFPNHRPRHLHLLPLHPASGFPPDRLALHRPPPPYTLIGHRPPANHEFPSHECWVGDAVEDASVCHPFLKTECRPLTLSRKTITDVEQCHDITRTVCTTTTRSIDNKLCSYNQKPKHVKTRAKTAEVSFVVECRNQHVTVCRPEGYSPPGRGRWCHRLDAACISGTGALYCNPLLQRTCTHTPRLKAVHPSVEVIVVEPEKACMTKTISLPQITCEDITESRCIRVPQAEVEEEGAQKCLSTLEEECREAELELPKQACRNLLEGELRKPVRVK